MGLAGCGSSEDPSSPSPDSGSNGNGNGSSPTDGTKHLQVSSSEASTTLHPIRVGNSTIPDVFVRQWTYSKLTWLDHNLEPNPDLATSWEANDDATAWEFQLRDDATFNHDGSDVLAEDVKATLDTIYEEGQEYSGKNALGPINSVEVINDQAVQINLSAPDASLPRKLGTPPGNIVAKSALEDEFETMNNSTFGSGPFQLDEYEVGNYTEVSAADEYHMEDAEGNALPYLDSATITTIPEVSTEVSELKQGSIDILNRVDPTYWEELTDYDGVQTQQMTGGYFHPLEMRVTAEPFDDIHVRRAVKYAIDKEQILSIVGNGLGTLGQDTGIGPAHPYFAEVEDEFGTTADIDAARAELEEAGLADGFSVDTPMYCPAEGTPATGETAVLVKEQLSQIGIETSIQETTWGRFLSEYWTETAETPIVVNSIAMRPITDQMLYFVGHSEGSLNKELVPESVQPEFDEALTAATSTTDESERQDLLTQCQEILHQQSGYVAPFFTARLTAARDRVENYNVEPTGNSLPLHAVDVSSTSE
jgi:peptide/nickel transport system substrate-binding protein